MDCKNNRKVQVVGLTGQDVRNANLTELQVGDIQNGCNHCQAGGKCIGGKHYITAGYFQRGVDAAGCTKGCREVKKEPAARQSCR